MQLEKLRILRFFPSANKGSSPKPATLETFSVVESSYFSLFRSMVINKRSISNDCLIACDVTVPRRHGHY